MNNAFPLVSVIVTTYNGAAYIAETIRSVTAQTMHNWELIIADDGSTDDTCSIIGSFADPRIHLLQFDRIGRNGRVKNLAINQAKGEYLAFIDHDDCWHPQKLEKQLHALKQNPGAGYCLCGGYNFYEVSVPVEFFYSQREGFRSGNLFLPLFRSEIAPWTQALLMRRSWLDKCGLFCEETTFADPEFLYRLAWHCEGVLIYDPMAYHRLHTTNYTRLNWQQSHEEGLAVIRKLRDEGLLPATIANDVLFRSHIRFGEKCRGRRLGKPALRSFWKAWRTRPSSIIPLKKACRLLLSFFQ